MSWARKLEQAEALFTSGNRAQAQALVLPLLATDPPQSLRLRAAKLLRKLKAWDLAMNVLCSKKGARSPAEDLEYSYCLIRVGSSEGALKILGKLDGESLPEYSFVKSVAYIGVWDYEAAIAPLMHYLKTVVTNPYQRAVASVNLGSALINEMRWDEAEVILEAAAEICPQGSPLSLTLWQTILQLYIWSDRFDLAERALTAMNQVLAHLGIRDDFTIQLWISVTDAMKSRGRVSAEGILGPIRQEAVQRRNYEIVRSLDFYQTYCDQKQDLAKYLYAGTPFPAFRKRLQREFSTMDLVADTYKWSLGSGINEQPPWDFMGKGPSLPKPLQPVFQALTRDFYRPQAVAQISELVFARQFYNSARHSNQILAAIKKLREWFKEKGVPLYISSVGNRYQLEPERPCQILIRLR